MESFYSNWRHCTIKQVNKNTAKKFYESGKVVFFQSSNMQFNSVWQHACPIEKKYKSLYETFETICNDFAYYNCDNERGKYIKFYVEEK